MLRLIGNLSRRGGLRRNSAAQRAALRVNRAQVDAAGKSVKPRARPLNKTDVSYVYGRNRRLNVEIDTSKKSSDRHRRIVNRRDGNATNVFAIVDPWTGQPTSVKICGPKPKTGPRRCATRTGAAARRLLQRLPKPVAPAK
jgi:hypothetical protein